MADRAVLLACCDDTDAAAGCSSCLWLCLLLTRAGASGWLPACADAGRVGLADAACFGIKMPSTFLPARVLRSDGQTPAGVCARVECVACDWIQDNEAAAVAGSGCVPDHLLRVCV